MRWKIKKPIKKAACIAGRTAEEKLLSRSYTKQAELSSLKTLIGEILLFGNKQQKGFWPLFDAMIRQYIYLKASQDSYCSG